MAPSCEIGVIGLGVMGRNLLLNMADHGHVVAGFDRNPDQVKFLGRESGGNEAVKGATDVRSFAALLKRPRKVLLLVPAGDAVDSVIREILLHVAEGDLLIDAGNSHFRDTERRARELAPSGIRYLGVGVSGGEEGARHGASIMPGGPRDAYESVKGVLEDAAARADGEVCIAYLGPGSAGHYVKMVHNGIEYGLMQLIAETYDLMKRGLGLASGELAPVYDRWNRGEISAFLVESAARVLGRLDERTGRPLVDLILDTAEQKGTGTWTSQDAMDLHVPVPTIDAAVAMRNLSGLKALRVEAERALAAPQRTFRGDRERFVERIGGALLGAMILTYAQGMAQLGKASQVYGYGLSLADVARIWQGGCIIRSALLKGIRKAYERKADLPSLLLDPGLGRELESRQEELRAVVQTAAGMSIPVPAMMASLAYLDGLRSGRLPANLVQAQRDQFGAHTYERVDQAGKFHTRW
ncbi:MAG: NADP-dependent phosphogluconate dehydrogenase [bacterium]